MKYLLLPHLFHSGEIHCLDVNQDNTKLVTGGKDHNISIWNLQELLAVANLHKEDPAKLGLDKLIRNIKPYQEITCHNLTVCVLRWLPNSSNKFISSSVDGSIYYHEFKNNDGNKKPFTTKIYPFEKVLNATPRPELVSKSLVDLTVSKDGRLVAWSTLDKKIFVYDIEKSTFQELYASSLEGEESAVVQRSLAFNNVCNYLVSIGDDTQINVFQYIYDPTSTLYKFRLINRITKLLNKNPLNARYKRISWSPNGELVTVPTANKNLTSLITLLSSQDWNAKESLVGHDLSCEVVKFSPCLYSELENEMNNIFNVVASAGSDKTLALWNSSKQTPITVLTDLVDGQIYDIAWAISKTEKKEEVSETNETINSTGNNSLLFCSSLGNLGILSFDANELGYEISNQTLDQLKKLQEELVKPMSYRYDYESNGNRKPSAIEYIDQKDAIDPYVEILNKDIRDLRDNRDSRDGNKDGKDEAIDNAEQRKKKGSIIPEVIDAPNPIKESPPLTLHNKQSLSKENTTQTQTQTEIQTQTAPTKPTANLAASTVVVTDANVDADVNLNANANSTAKKTLSARTTNTSAHTNGLDISKTQKVSTKNGKRRIQPTLLSNGNSTNTEIIRSSAPDVKQQTNSTMEFDKPSFSVSDRFARAKRTRSEENGEAERGNSTTKKPRRELEPVKFIGSVIVNPNTTFSKIRLATPKVRMGFQVCSKKDELFVLDVKNGSGNETKPSRITYLRNEKEVWCDFIPKFVQLACEGETFWVIATVDGQLLSYSRLSGKKLLPTIVLGSPVSFLESHSNYLMATTSIGELYVWDMLRKKCELTCSITSLLELGTKFQDDGLLKSDSITMCSITSKGIPLVTLSNGMGYLYNKDLEAWLVISESWWSFGSYYWDSVEDEREKSLQTMNMFNNKEESIIELLEHKTNIEIIRKTRTGRGKYFNKMAKNMIMKEGFESLEKTISVSHLENRILCCELLGEHKDFHNYFKIYVQRICELGQKVKLYEVCDELLGPDVQASKQDFSQKNDWKPTICGFDKRELLKEVIVLCSQFRDAQRVLLHFAKKINLVGDSSEVELPKV